MAQRHGPEVNADNFEQAPLSISAHAEGAKCLSEGGAGSSLMKGVSLPCVGRAK